MSVGRPPPSSIDGLDFNAFLTKLIEPNVIKFFEISDKGWNEEGRGAVICTFAIDSTGKRTSDDFDFGYISFQKVKETINYVAITDSVSKYNRRSEAVLVLIIDVAGENPFICSLALNRKKTSEV